MVTSNISLGVLVPWVKLQPILKSAPGWIWNYRRGRFSVLLFRCIHSSFSLA